MQIDKKKEWKDWNGLEWYIASETWDLVDEIPGTPMPLPAWQLKKLKYNSVRLVIVRQKTQTVKSDNSEVKWWKQ